jgi:hypothetical protein
MEVIIITIDQINSENMQRIQEYWNVRNDLHNPLNEEFSQWYRNFGYALREEFFYPGAMIITYLKKFNLHKGNG